MFMDMPPVVDTNVPAAIEVLMISAASNVAVTPLNTTYLLMNSPTKPNAIALSAMSVSFPVPVPMGGGGTTQPDSEVSSVFVRC